MSPGTFRSYGFVALNAPNPGRGRRLSPALVSPFTPSAPLLARALSFEVHLVRSRRHPRKTSKRGPRVWHAWHVTNDCSGIDRLCKWKVHSSSSLNLIVCRRCRVRFPSMSLGCCCLGPKQEYQVLIGGNTRLSRHSLHEKNQGTRRLAEVNIKERTKHNGECGAQARHARADIAMKSLHVLLMRWSPDSIRSKWGTHPWRHGEEI